jgi:hypothetical protein
MVTACSTTRWYGLAAACRLPVLCIIQCRCFLCNCTRCISLYCSRVQQCLAPGPEWVLGTRVVSYGLQRNKWRQGVLAQLCRWRQHWESGVAAAAGCAHACGAWLVLEVDTAVTLTWAAWSAVTGTPHRASGVAQGLTTPW